MTQDKPATLFGFPVVSSEEMQQHEVLLGRLPTAEEIREHGSLEKAIEAQAKQWAIIKGVDNPK